MTESSPWKACDIRGIFPAEVSADLFYRVGIGLIDSLGASKRVLVAGDFRVSTSELLTALCDGLLSSGIDVVDAGKVPTPVAYFAHQQCKTDAVVIVTASHNPAEHNGLKLMIGDVPPSSQDWMEIRRATGEARAPRTLRGQRTYVDAVSRYQEWILRRWRNRGRAMHVALDAGGGAWSQLAPNIFEALGFRVERLWCEIDGSFSFRSPDCARAENLRSLCDTVRRVHADLGFAWDGDGDRLAVVSPEGSVVTADQLSILFIHHVLKNESHQSVVCDVKLSDSVRKTVLELGGTPVIEKSGHCYIKRRMIASDCVFGCELSGHYFHRELHGGDDGLFSALQVSEAIADAGGWEKASACIPRMYVTPDVRLRVDLTLCDAVISNLCDAMQPERRCTLDGVRIENSKGYILVRQSVTEPLITLRIEGTSQENLEQLIQLCCANLPDTVSTQFTKQITGWGGLHVSR
jgi:phosphomannomutase/phosphoglucomutase